VLINNRVILKKAAVFTDISKVLCDPYEGLQAFTAVVADDAIYIGSDLPFNNRFFLLGKKNTIAGTVAVSFWSGSAFTAAVDVQDLTSVGGVPFARSGLIRFDLPKNTAWSKVYDSTDITELAGVTARAQFWAKLTFSAAFDLEFKYVGFSFAKDSDLRTYYPQMLQETTMRAFNGGTPMQNWDALHVVAAEEVIEALKREQVVVSGNQLLDTELFKNAQCHKLAELAYGPGGLRNTDTMELAAERFQKSIAKRIFNVDENKNGRLDSVEKTENCLLRRV
jgi:hypothetical protein